MKIVIITHHIYPAINARSFRATELAIQLARMGHDVTLYAVLGKFDYSNFMKETNVRVKGFGKFYPSISTSDGIWKISFFRRVLLRLMSFLTWYPLPMLDLMRRTVDIVKVEKTTDLLITIAGAYPIHWGAAKAKQKLGGRFPTVWISDCGDPFMSNSVGRKPPFYFRYFENFWGRMTDIITIPIEGGRKGYSPDVQDKIRIIPQGFDFSRIKLCSDRPQYKVPTFAYSGMVYRGYRDPSKFLDYLSTIKKGFKFIVYTDSFVFWSPFKEKLGEKLELREYVDRDTLLYELSKMDFLVNIENNSKVQSPSKLIDYSLTKRPILDITTDFSEKTVVDEFLEENYANAHPYIDISQYDIVNVARSFVNIYQEKREK